MVDREELRATITEFDVAQSHEKWKAGEVKLIDVREPDEWDQGIIEGAELISLGEFVVAAGDIAKSHEGPIVIYCAHGNRSVYAAASMQTAGKENVASMAGGIVAWYNGGYPIVERP